MNRKYIVTFEAVFEASGATNIGVEYEFTDLSAALKFAGTLATANQVTDILVGYRGFDPGGTYVGTVWLHARKVTAGSDLFNEAALA